METIISKVLKKEPNFEFIGKDQQVLQILLAPQQKIITRSSSVIYFSNNIKPTTQVSAPEQNNFANFFSIFGRRKNIHYEELTYELNNQSEGLGYVGLSQKAGKILAVNPIIFNYLVIREKNVLAFSRSIELMWKYKPNFKILAASNWCKIRNLALEKDGLLFLQAGSTMIEKELGSGESIMVREDCLLAFTNQVTFAESPSSNKNSMKGRNIIEIKGPGTIFVENQLLSNESILKDSRVLEIFFLMSIFLYSKDWP